MKQSLIVIMSFSTMMAAAQGSKIPLDKAFIEKTIEYYYSTVARQQKGTALFFIERDSLTMHAKTDYSVFKVQFISASEAAAKLADRNKKDGKLDKLQVKWISLDTIDVVITGCTIGVRKVRKTVNQKTVSVTENFLSNCTEAWVDIPTCRFVYNQTTTAWTQINHKD